MVTDTPQRATTLADAAIAVIAHHGLRGLTHRAVEARAGLPAGSTTYYFPTRSALLRGVMARLLELDQLDFAAFGVLAAPADRARLVRSWTRLLAHLTSDGRSRQVARYALYLDSEADEERRLLLAEATAAIQAGGVQVARSLGSPRPRRDGHLLVALLDGLLYDQLVRPPVSAAELRRRVALVFDTVLP